MPTSHKSPVSASLLSLEPDWIRELTGKNRAPSTIETYLLQLQRFCTWLSPDGKAAHCTTTLVQVDRTCITSYFGWMYAHYAENTVLGAYNALSIFFDLAIDYGAMDEGTNPLRWIERPKPVLNPPPILTDEQIKRLLATCENAKDFKGLRDYALLRVFLSTGMRLREVAQIAVADVDTALGVIDVSHGKGGRSRLVAIGDKTAKAIRKYQFARERQKHAGDPELFLSQRGALSVKTIWGMVAARARAAGLEGEGVHPHAFRHWFAHGFLSAEGNESDLKTLAGWSSSKMLERYGASRAKERAVAAHHRLRIGEKW